MCLKCSLFKIRVLCQRYPIFHPVFAELGFGCKYCIANLTERFYEIHMCGWACWLVCKYWFLEIQLPRPLQSLTVMATERLILVNWH